jgi:acyl-CoA reductase-like NAD-dependent aldehyde dehydrogenase
MQWLTDTISGIGARIKGTAQPAADSVDMGPLVDDSQAQKALGTAPEAPGTTMTGGKRRHRTRRHRKAKKTHKRKH